MLAPPSAAQGGNAAVHRVQLEILREFLVSMPSNLVRVAFIQGEFLGNLTIVGDWFGALVLPSQPGLEYRQTVFCHHAPTVLRWQRDFDRKIERCFRAWSVEPDASRDNAVRWIDSRLAEAG